MPGKVSQKKAARKAKQGKKPTATVNQNRMKTTHAPAAVGMDFQTYFKESRKTVKYKGELKDAIVVEGVDYLGPVTVPAEEVPGAVYDEFYLSPSEFAGTRLSLYARLYEKFLFEEMDFMYLPAVGSDVAGQLVIAHDRDISDDTPPATQQGVRQFLAMEDMKAGNVWTAHTAKCPLRSNEDGFFTNPVTGGDDRLAYQGQVYVACVVPSGAAEGATLGTLLVHYKCVFFIPQLEQELDQIIGVDTTVTYPTVPVATPVSVDVFNLVSNAPNIIRGIQQWLPTLQPDGTFAVKVPEGLYNMYTSLANGSSSGTSQGELSMNPPTLVALQPQPAPAPQPEVEAYLSTEAYLGGGLLNNVGDATWMGYLNVPRGGGLIRQTATALTQGGGDMTVSALQAGINLFKMGGVAQSLLNIVPAPTPAQAREAAQLGVPKDVIKKSSAMKLWRLTALVREDSARCRANEPAATPNSVLPTQGKPSEGNVGGKAPAAAASPLPSWAFDSKARRPGAT